MDFKEICAWVWKVNLETIVINKCNFNNHAFIINNNVMVLENYAKIKNNNISNNKDLFMVITVKGVDSIKVWENVVEDKVKGKDLVENNVREEALEKWEWVCAKILEI